MHTMVNTKLLDMSLIKITTVVFLVKNTHTDPCEDTFAKFMIIGWQ